MTESAKQLRERIADHFGVASKSRLRSQINAVIRECFAGGAELLDTLEWANGCRETTLNRGSSTTFTDQVIARLEAIRADMEQDIRQEVTDTDAGD